MMAFIMSNGLVIAGALLGILSAVSIILHIVHLDKLAALDDKVVAIMKQAGVQPPQA